MTIKVGDTFPSVALKRLEEGTMKDFNTSDLSKGKVVLFGVPGAFTPTCSNKHLPSYVNNATELAGKGVKRIFCMAVNDPFVMAAWSKEHGADKVVDMIPDGNAALTKALGLEMDGSGYGMGVRSQRFSMLLQDGVVKALHVEKPGAFEVCSAEAMLKGM